MKMLDMYYELLLRFADPKNYKKGDADVFRRFELAIATKNHKTMGLDYDYDYDIHQKYHYIKEGIFSAFKKVQQTFEHNFNHQPELAALKQLETNLVNFSDVSLSAIADIILSALNIYKNLGLTPKA